MTPLDLSFVIVLAITILALLVILGAAGHAVLKQSDRQSAMIQSLTKLAASKDIASFAALEAGSKAVNEVSMPYVPQDDESVARLLAKQYSSRGLDPNLACSEDSDPFEEFGGTSAFI